MRFRLSSDFVNELPVSSVNANVLIEACQGIVSDGCICSIVVGILPMTPGHLAYGAHLRHRGKRFSSHPLANQFRQKIRERHNIFPNAGPLKRRDVPELQSTLFDLSSVRGDHADTHQ